MESQNIDLHGIKRLKSKIETLRLKAHNDLQWELDKAGLKVELVETSFDWVCVNSLKLALKDTRDKWICANERYKVRTTQSEQKQQQLQKMFDTKWKEMRDTTWQGYVPRSIKTEMKF